MSWLILVVAGLFEVAWASVLAETKGFTRVVPTVGFLLTLAISMFLLQVATRTIPIGTGYAVWVGIGALGAFLVAVLFRGQSTSIGQVLAMAALVASIIAVKLTATIDESPVEHHWGTVPRRSGWHLGRHPLRGFDGTQGCRCLKRNRCRPRALRKLRERSKSARIRA